MARRPEGPTREESPEESFCPTDHRLTPLGHPGGTGNRLREQGRGRLLTILPWYPLASNLACINEATPRGESPEAIRPDPDGHPAEIPTATRPRLRGQARTRTCSRAGVAQRRHPHVAYAIPDWLGERNPGVLTPGLSRSAALGPRAWEERETDSERSERSIYIMSSGTLVPNHCSEDSRVRTGITEQVVTMNLPNVRVSFCQFSGPFGVLWDKCESDVGTSKGDSIRNLRRVFSCRAEDRPNCISYWLR